MPFVETVKVKLSPVPSGGAKVIVSPTAYPNPLFSDILIVKFEVETAEFIVKDKP